MVKEILSISRFPSIVRVALTVHGKARFSVCRQFLVHLHLSTCNHHVKTGSDFLPMLYLINVYRGLNIPYLSRLLARRGPVVTDFLCSLW